MQRRDVLKGLTTLSGGALLGGMRTVFAQQAVQGANPPLATPIRGLINKNGALQQPIQISIRLFGASESAVTTLNGVEVDRRQLSEGMTVFQVFTAPVDRTQDVNVSVTVGDQPVSAIVTLLPVRKVTVYILPHSHHDLGYTDIQPHIEEKQMNNIALAIDLARTTADYPAGARFVWNEEVLWGTDLYLSRKSQAEQDAFLDAVKKGSICLNGMYANELTGLCRPEELMQLFRYSLDLSRRCGVTIDSAMLSDVPGYTWGTVTAMAQAGIRYFSAAPNNSDRIGTVRNEWHDKPFWHVSRSGKERVLVWMPGHGYSTWPAANEEMVAGCQEFLDTVNFPYDISYIRWSGHGDNAVPDPQICEFVKSWNQDFEWPKFIISSTGEAFSAFEKRYGNQVPLFKGDITPYWEDGAGSSALETRINRNSADRLVQAQTLAATRTPAEYKVADFDQTWRNILLYSEHTWGASASVRDPDASITKQQWAFKRQFALDGESQSKNLVAEMFPTAGNDTTSIDVFNTTSWQRTELVFVTKELSMAGDHAKDHEGRPVPSQRLSTGELAILVREIPPFSSVRFHLSKVLPQPPALRVSATNHSLENGIVRIAIDPQTGNIIEFTRHGSGANLIDTGCGGAANEYLFVKGKDFEEVRKTQNKALALHAQDIALDGPDVGAIEKSGPAQIRIEEEGPLVACLRIESSAPGCNNLVRRVRLLSGADWVELSNTVDKKASPRNPNPNGTDRAWADYGGKESVHFAFPFAVPNGEMHMDIPLAEMRPEVDQLPGACKNWLPVGRWIDIANDQAGVTWVTLDAPLVEIGKISATLVGSNHNPLLWRDQIAPTTKLYSWAMNNHWETNYCASQEGPVEFRYALRVHGRYDPADASRFAIGLSQPLLAGAASSIPTVQPLLRIEPADVLAVALKPSDDGKARVVRLFGASGEERKATLRWSAPPQNVWRSDLSEKPIEPLTGEITVAGWDLVTLRVE